MQRKAAAPVTADELAAAFGRVIALVKPGRPAGNAGQGGKGGGRVGWSAESEEGDPLALAQEMDLSITQVRCLMIVNGHGGEMSLGELSDCIRLSPAAASRAVDRLVQLELVTRREHEADRRVKRVALSERGQEAVARFARARQGALRRFAGALTDDERGELAAVLTKIADRLGAEGGPPACGAPEEKEEDRA